MNNDDLEAFRRRLKFRKVKKTDIVKPFYKEGIARRTICANIERLHSVGLSKKWTADLLDSH
jgi:hypothetical protein